MFLYILFPFQLSKMAMKNLVEGECGVTNSLLKFSSHFTQDKGFKQVSQYKTLVGNRSLSTLSKLWL